MLGSTWPSSTHRIKELASAVRGHPGQRLRREGVTSFPAGHASPSSNRPGSSRRGARLRRHGRRRTRGRRHPARHRRRRRGCCDTARPTAIASCPGATSSTWTGSQSTSSWSAPASPVPSSPAATASSGAPVTLVSSRDRVLPGEDPDAADVIEQVFTARGGTLVKRARAAAVRADRRRRVVELEDGRIVAGSHALMCLGSVPNASGLGLEHVGVKLDERGLHRGRPGFPHVRAVDLRGRGLHWRAAARLRRRHAGPHRDVARARRGGRRRCG